MSARHQRQKKVPRMLAIDIDRPEGDQDLERRRELRTFLIDCRSRIAPVDVGLPRTTRRQVPGLRRGEVAEIIGVTTDWYRAFESGRPVRVSPRFVSRLAGAFGLEPAQKLKLFCLAFGELYGL
jgi:hypothetical protein